MSGSPVISAAVEGDVDAVVVRRLVVAAGASLGGVYGRRGKIYLREKMAGFENAAQRSPWVVLVDLDRDFECAPPLREAWLTRPSPKLCFRIAVRAVESWLLADRDAAADFLGVARSRLPADPEDLLDPKATMLDLARASRRRHVRIDMLPRPESGRRVGPAYASRLIDFAETHWRPEVAARRSASLERAVRSLERLVEAQT